MNWVVPIPIQNDESIGQHDPPPPPLSNQVPEWLLPSPPPDRHRLITSLSVLSQIEILLIVVLKLQ